MVQTRLPRSVSLVADLGSTPPVDDVARYLRAVDSIWFFSMQMALLAADDAAGAEARRALRIARSQAGDAANLDDPLFTGPRSPLGQYRTFLADYIPTPGIQRLQIASPLEVVLTGVASEIKPIGYAMGGMLIVERIFKLVMQWQRHRYDLQRGDPEPETLREDLIGTEIAHGLSSQGGLVIPFRVDEVQAALSISRVAHYPVIEVNVYDGSPRYPRCGVPGLPRPRRRPSRTSHPRARRTNHESAGKPAGRAVAATLPLTAGRPGTPA